MPTIPEKKTQRPRTEERNLLAAEDREEYNELRDDILSLPEFKEDKKNRSQGPPEEETVIDETGLTGKEIPEGTPKGTKPPAKAKEPKAPVAVTTPTFDSPLSDEELESAISSFKPRTEAERKGFPGIHSVIKKVNALARTLQEQLGERDTRIKELEGKVLPDEEVSKLRGFEKTVSQFAVRALPKWQRYDAEISDSLTKATGIIMAMAGTDEKEKAKYESALKVIAQRGGFLSINGATSFIDSTEPSGQKDEKGNPLTNAEFFRKHFYNKLPGHKQREFDLLISRAEERAREKTSELTKAEADAKSSIEKEQAEFQAQWAKEADAAVKEFLPPILTDLGLPTARPEVPKDGTSEEKKEALALQKEWDEADKQIVAKSHPSYRFSAKGKDLVIGTVKEVAFDLLLPRYKKLLDEVHQLRDADATHKAEMEELKNTRRTNRLESTPSPISPKSDYLELSDEDALAKAGWTK